jgi:phosphatidylglycerophosphate synthase
VAGPGLDDAAAPDTPAPFADRYRSALRGLQQAQKTPRGVSLYSTWVNRPWGRRLAALGDALHLTPNTLTLASAACSLTAVVLLALLPRTVPVGLVAGALLMLGFALDSADGQLARLRRSGSSAGEYLDHMLDCVVKATLHAAVLVALHREGEREAVLLLPLSFQVVSLALFFGSILVAKMRESSSLPEQDRPGRRVSSVTSSVALLPADHGVLCASFLVWGVPSVFLPVYGLLLLVNAALLAVFSVVWLRELS